MKIRIAYHKEKEVQQFNDVIELLKPKIKSIKPLKNAGKNTHNVVFIILKKCEKTTI